MNCLPGLRSRFALLELVARTEAEPESDEAHFLRQFRAAIAELDRESCARRERPNLRLVHSAE